MGMGMHTHPTIEDIHTEPITIHVATPDLPDGAMLGWTSTQLTAYIKGQ